MRELEYTLRRTLKVLNPDSTGSRIESVRSSRTLYVQALLCEYSQYSQYQRLKYDQLWQYPRYRNPKYCQYLRTRGYVYTDSFRPNYCEYRQYPQHRGVQAVSALTAEYRYKYPTVGVRPTLVRLGSPQAVCALQIICVIQ